MTKSLSVVTGASSGIGACYADRLAARGSDLLLVARRQDHLEQIAEKIRKSHGVKVDFMTADLTDAKALKSLEVYLSEFPVTMLVNNAGAGGLGPTALRGVDAQEQLIALNVVSLVRLSLAALAAFQKRDVGTLVNISSVVAFSPSAGGASYSGSKSFVLNFTRSLQMEYQQSAMNIQLVMPGPVRTEFFKSQGMDDSVFPDSAYISAEALVDAAMSGLDAGETITIPTLKSFEIWQTMEASRKAFLSDVIGGKVAARY